MLESEQTVLDRLCQRIFQLEDPPAYVHSELSDHLEILMIEILMLQTCVILSTSTRRPTTSSNGASWLCQRISASPTLRKNWSVRILAGGLSVGAH